MNKPKNLKAVVFCKHCINYGIYEALPEGAEEFDKTVKVPYCMKWGGLSCIGEEDFCSYGKLKEMEANDE